MGEITPNLHAVTAGIRDSTILLWAYYDESATGLEMDRITSVGAEVVADFPESLQIEEKVFFLGQSKLEMLDFWAFMRAQS